MTGPTTRTDAWIRRFHPAENPAVRLVCFPHAGGAASFFHPVSAAVRRSRLNGRAEVLAVQYPGRQDRREEEPITEIGRIAEHAAAALAAWAAEPLVFFGHSMGAVVAFETARRLEAQAPADGRDTCVPATLVASGRRAPSRTRPESVHRRDDAGVLAELRALDGTDPGVLDDAELQRMILPAIRADYRAIETYECLPDARLRCPVTVFVGDADPQVTLDEAQDWAVHTTGRFDLEIFEGGHFYLTASPAATIDRLLRTVERYG